MRDCSAECHPGSVPLKVTPGRKPGVFNLETPHGSVGYMVLGSGPDGTADDVALDIQRGLALLYHIGAAYQISDMILHKAVS